MDTKCNVNITFKQGKKVYTVIADQVLWHEYDKSYDVYFDHLVISCKAKIVNVNPTMRDQQIEDGFRYTIERM